MARLEPLKSGLLTTRVSETFRLAILSGQFEPGRQLLEAHLARELQVSQTTVREALVQLDQVGLVTRVPNKGTFVTNLTEDDVRDRLTIRWLLEGLAWIEAAQRLDDEGYVELDKRLRCVTAAVEQNDLPHAADAELDFHRFIWEASGNATLVEALEKLSPPLFAYITIQRRQHGVSNERAPERHSDVITALKTRDPKTIRETLDDHFLGSFQDRFEKPSDHVAALLDPAAERL